MANFWCPSCKQVLKRDLRLASTKYFLTPSGRYRTFCSTKHRNVLARPVGKGAQRG